MVLVLAFSISGKRVWTIFFCQNNCALAVKEIETLNKSSKNVLIISLFYPSAQIYILIRRFAAIYTLVLTKCCVS